MNSDNHINAIAEQLKQARHCVVLTGAGVSAESGIPTFRDALSGLWEKFRPEDLATAEAYRKNPEMVYAWYQWRRQLISDTEPNAGHYALAELAKRVERLTLITQNVDGLHQRAGSADVIEFHGNIFRNRCFAENTALAPDTTRSEKPPLCPVCGAMARPDVVWFGEALEPQVLQASAEAIDDCDVFLSIGTSSLVYPASELGLAARSNGAVLIEINPQQTPLTAVCQFSVTANSAGVLPHMVRALKT
ncbi:MAG: NAD-dependent deacylase [Gammaproteobacteria bacterium]|nr:NAD-dependent deacylase [Gammaproteobacteria bacterium]